MPERMSKKQPWSVIWPASTASLIHGNVIRLSSDRRTNSCSQMSWRSSGGACMARCRAGSAMRTHWPTKSEASTGAPSKQRFDAAAHGVAQHDDLADRKRPHRELDGRADPVRLVVGAVRRRDVGDVADDEELARPGVEHHLRVGAAVRAGDDQRAGPLAEPAQRFEASALGLPGAGAEAAIAFDQVVHGEPIIYFSRGSFPHDITASKKDASPHG